MVEYDTLAPDERDDSCSPYPRFLFARLHLPTLTAQTVGRRFVSRSVFLEEMARWNRLGATQTGKPEWMYYEVPQ